MRCLCYESRITDSFLRFSTMNSASPWKAHNKALCHGWLRVLTRCTAAQPRFKLLSSWCTSKIELYFIYLFIYSEIAQCFNFNKHLRKSGSFERPSICSTVKVFLKISLRLEKIKHLGSYETGRICLSFFSPYFLFKAINLKCIGT